MLKAGRQPPEGGSKRCTLCVCVTPSMFAHVLIQNLNSVLFLWSISFVVTPRRHAKQAFILQAACAQRSVKLTRVEFLHVANSWCHMRLLQACGA